MLQCYPSERIEIVPWAERMLSVFDNRENRRTFYMQIIFLSDVVASPWQSNPETNQKLRQVTYTLTLPPNSFGPKVSHVTETQVRSL